MFAMTLSLKKSCFPSFLQLIPLAIHCIRMWSYLQPMEQSQAMDTGCCRLTTVARDIYSRFGWQFDYCLTY
jgi:hypothetical protein